MSKKYVIEIKPEYEDSFKGLMILGAKGSDIYVDALSVEDLEELNSDYINEHFGELQDMAYQRGVEDGAKSVENWNNEEKKLRLDEAYQRGLDDAWEMAKRIVLTKTDANCPYFSPEELNSIFGYSTLQRVIDTYSVSEAIEKVKAYEEQQKADAEIKVGDEVCFVFAGGETIEPFIVFSIKDDNGKKYYEGIQTSDGRWVGGGLKYYKTGRHFPQVAELLKAMKGGAE
jgi:hypothetical protein